MKNFEKYFTKRGYHPNTIRSYCNLLKQYQRWCKANCIDSEAATLEELYDYQSHCRDRGLKTRTIRERIIMLKHYYRSISREDNPALLIRTEKEEKKLPKGMMDEEMLMELYLAALPRTLTQKRDKVMLGLVLFQGLRRNELANLRLEHINKGQSKLYVTETLKTNARYIDIKAVQRADLQNYIYTLREQLLIEARKETDAMFFSQGTGAKLDNALGFMFRNVKNKFPSVDSLQQLRESRITLWVKQFGIRQTQYLSGIRYASSVLRYKAIDNEKLKHKIALIHPMESM